MVCDTSFMRFGLKIVELTFGFAPTGLAFAVPWASADAIELAQVFP